jgi:hypothetical protein
MLEKDGVEGRLEEGEGTNLVRNMQGVCRKHKETVTEWGRKWQSLTLGFLQHRFQGLQ